MDTDNIIYVHLFRESNSSINFPNDWKRRKYALDCFLSLHVEPTLNTDCTDTDTFHTFRR